MAKLFALKSGTQEIFPDAWNSDFSNLKQQALFFDQIGFYKLNDFYNILDESLHLWKKSHPDFQTDKAEAILTELKWLQKQNLIFELKLEELGNPEFITANIGVPFENTKASSKEYWKFNLLIRKVIEMMHVTKNCFVNNTL